VTPDEARSLLAAVLARAEALQREWAPHKPTAKQLEFLGLDCLEALYGGAAGGGKSDALLMAALQFVNVPGYAALLLRRTYADLSLPGALMDRAHEWLQGSGTEWRDTDKTWRFPSGASITFGYLETERDKFRYQGAEFQMVGFDELTQFTETQYTYLLSRLRRLQGSTIPLRARGATNPGGIGHEWVKRRFVDQATSNGRRFVPARLDDNPHVDQEAYDAALQQLDTTTRMQLRDGLWVRDAGGLIYRYNPDVNLVPCLPERNDWQYIFCVDFGSSQKNPTTAMGVLAYCAELPAVYLVESEKRAGMIPSTIAERFRQYSIAYGGFDHVIGDQGGLGSGYIEEFRARHGIPMRGVEKKDKLGYRKLMNGDIETGRFLVVDGKNDVWIEEANTLSWNEAGTDCEKSQPDHATDMALYGWREARHWRAVAPVQAPKQGTPEYWQQEAKRMEKAAEDRVMSADRGDWWDRGMM
jgi:hypothetical protein